MLIIIIDKPERLVASDFATAPHRRLEIPMNRIPFLVACAALPAYLCAAERPFTYVHESAVLAPGQREAELWTTWQGGPSDREYRRVDARLELELGVAPDTQVALYLNHRRTSVDGVSESEFEGVSVELKRRFSDPVADGLGSAIYIEGTVNGSETELELKGIADWRMDAWSVALNTTGEIEAAEQPGDATTGPGTETSYEVKLSAAIGRTLSATWSVGLEIENRNPLDETGTWESSTLWMGPAVHFANPHLWSTLTVLPQIANLGGEADSGTRELQGHSRVEARLLFGMNF